jgi:hypothetical protein
MRSLALLSKEDFSQVRLIFNHFITRTTSLDNYLLYFGRILLFTQMEGKTQKGTNPSIISTLAGEAVIVYPTGLKLFMVMGSLLLGTILISLDTTIISVATPTITAEFHALNDVGWYGAAYLMSLTSTNYPN